MILFDGDIIVYRAGYASDNCPCYMGSLKHAQDLVMDSINKARMALNDHNVHIYLTDSDIRNNNRFKLEPTYKQNRKGEKPSTYNELRQWMIDHLDAEVVTGIEADDALTRRAHEEGVVIASVDKDLLMVPGRHYNLTTGEITEATNPGKLWIEELISIKDMQIKDNEISRTVKKRLRGYGFKFFCAQMLMGDRADNIKGLKGYGDVKAYNLLKDKATIRDMWAAVKRAYRKEIPGLVYEYNGLDESFDVVSVANHRLLIAEQLLWMEQKDTLDDLLKKPKAPKD